MIGLLETAGPAIVRASWQGSVLALGVGLLLWSLGERIAPRWRFLLWGVVLARLLVVATPVSPWSLFNLVPTQAEVHVPAALEPGSPAPFSPPSYEPAAAPVPAVATEAPGTDLEALQRPEFSINTARTTPGEANQPAPSSIESAVATAAPGIRFDVRLLLQMLSAVWLIGCLALGLRLAAAALLLRRRLARCRPVSDPALLQMLQTACRRLGVRRVPALVVTPESLSPCLVGTLRPTIVLPESVVTESSEARLRHVLAHELAHLLRGDLWTNWLLLAVRILHWVNPVAWWTVREMQAHREAACDELAFTALGETDRHDYAASIIELAASLAPSPLAPGLVGLFSSKGRLQVRVERLLSSPSVPALKTPVAAALLLGIALLGLTDAMPATLAQAPTPPADQNDTPAASPEPNTTTHTITSRCVDSRTRKPLAGVPIRLYRAEGLVGSPVEIANAVTDKEGKYTFEGLVPPRPEGHLDRLTYSTFAFPPGGQIGSEFRSFRQGGETREVRVATESSTLTGKVVDTHGKPVADATVLPFQVNGHPVPGLPVATTGSDGTFRFDALPVFRTPDGRSFGMSFQVTHPDSAGATGKADALPADVTVALPAACLVTGTVVDSVTGKPAAGVLITAERVDETGPWGQEFAASDTDGRFRLPVAEGRYHILAEAPERVCVALTDQECAIGKNVELPPFQLIRGGLVSGRVINTATSQSVPVTTDGSSVAIGFFGPSQPHGRVISPKRLALVDAQGRYTFRAAPGDNFPYFVNTQGDRMAWDTREKLPVVVKEGETIPYDMLITPEIPPAERLQAARKIVGSFSKDPKERTAQILAEFRRLNNTIDETELWCLLMRELVTIGPAAVPQLTAELDGATEGRMLRRLGFALRAIGDSRAVPALVRAIPRTLLPSSSDYGLLVADPELTKFMQQYDLDPKDGGPYFDVGRPVREIFGALHLLTKQNFQDSEIFGMSLSEDPRRQVMQRRFYLARALQWQAWWDANASSFTNDVEYQTCNLPVRAETRLPAPDLRNLPKTTRAVGNVKGATLSPVTQGGEHAWHFCDLDTGYQWHWPADIPKNHEPGTIAALEKWAATSGADLMCDIHRSPEGIDTYVLRGLGLTLREIDTRTVRNLHQLLAAGELPEGRPVDSLLMHYDADSGKLVPNSNGAFLYVTRDGNIGLIETTDRITRTADLTGQPAGMAPGGVGFHLGVRFSLKILIP